jgi:hypothetical protein
MPGWREHESLVQETKRKERTMENPYTWFAIIAAVLLLAFGGNYLVGGLPSQSNAETALTNQGFEGVRLIKRHRFLVEFQGCGKEDVAKFDFEATNVRGRRVTVSACEGWPFKGATVRQ